MTLTIIESLSSPEFNDGICYTWTGYVEEGNKLSLFKLIEENDNHYKVKYLDWVNALGKHEFQGKSLVDHFTFKDGFSFWWMMPITEKSIWKSPYITDIIRLIAVEEVVKKHKPSKLRLQCNNRLLNEVLIKFCKIQGIEYEWHRLADMKATGTKSILQNIPIALLGILSILKYLFQRLSLSKQTKTDWISDDKSVFFCSYFFNLDPVSLRNGQHRSRYWGDLDKLLMELNLKSNWLQLYYKHVVIPNPEIALNTIRKFNEGKKESHRFLDSWLSLNLVFGIIGRLIWLRSKSFFLRGVNVAFDYGASGLSFWPLIRKEWYNSLYGPVAVSNLFNYKLFEKAISDLPHQKIGLYIFENQAWERAFIHFWKKNGHGNLIGVAHSTVRYWDFRYSSDSRMTSTNTEFIPLPFPDFIALNGKSAIDNYLSTKHVIKSYKQCEALRFLNIDKDSNPPKLKKSVHEGNKVLILGDYLTDGTSNLLKTLQDAIQLINCNITFTLKPHPANIVKPEDYPFLKFNVVYDALDEILNDYDIVYSGNSTSASVDAYLTGMRVIIILDEFQLNVSPLRSIENVNFVSTPDQLSKALSYPAERFRPVDVNDFFFLDPNLSRWRKILNLIK